MLKVLRSYIQSTVWPIKPPRRPQMKKWSTVIVFVSLKRLILIYKSFKSKFVCKIRAIGVQPCHEAKYGALHQTPCLIGSASKQIFCASYLTLKMTSDQKTLNIKVVHLVETVKIAFGLVSIRDHLLPRTWPTTCSQILPNSFGKFGPNKSELD